MNLLLTVAALLLVTCKSSLWDNVSAILEQGITTGVYPGCVAVVGTADGIVYAKPFGSYTYGVPPPFVPAGTPPNTIPAMQLTTLFDMASCTKVIATTSAVALLYQQGLLDLDMVVCDPSLLGPAFAVNGKDTITIRNLLLHNAGFPPDPVPNYSDPEFGCPQTSKPVPAEDFSCRNQIYDAVLNQTLVTPPNIQYVYSDLSFITLAFAIGSVIKANNLVPADSLLPACVQAGGLGVTQCYYEAYVRVVVLPLGGQAPGGGMMATGFLPTPGYWGMAAPCENDTSYEHKVIQGQVSDGNAYAMGGIAGHAGLFSNVLDIAQLVDALMFHPLPGFLTPETVHYFVREWNHTQSSRALGWNTNDPDVVDEGWDQVCGDKLSPVTFLHTGYTGTMICADTQNEFYTILLTNRVYPTDAPGSGPVHAVRQAFGDAVLAALAAERVPPAKRAEGEAEEKEKEKQREVFEGGDIHRPSSTAHNAPARVRDDAFVPESAVIPMHYPLFNQCDPRWGNDVMEVKTICQVGCLMSSVSMALNGWNISIDGVESDPAVLNQWLQKNGGYVDGDDLEEEVVYELSPAQIAYWGKYEWTNLPSQLPELLHQRLVVIANVNQGSHFVLVTGFLTNANGTDPSDWLVNDPGFNRRTYASSDIVGFRVFEFATPAQQ